MQAHVTDSHHMVVVPLPLLFEDHTVPMHLSLAAVTTEELKEWLLLGLQRRTRESEAYAANVRPSAPLQLKWQLQIAVDRIHDLLNTINISEFILI